MHRRWAGVVLMAVLVASCSGDEGGDPTTATSSAAASTTSTTFAATPTTAAAPPADDDAGADASPIITDTIRAYFEAFALNDEGREAMLAAAQEGSAAHAYATYWWTVWLAAGPAGSFTQVIDFEAGEISACIPPEQGTATDSGCITYTNFVTDPATGLLIDFEERGAPVSATVAMGDGTIASADGVSLRVVVATVAGSDRISVVWENTNESAELSEGNIRMVTASGDIVQPEAWTQNDVPANGSTLNAANFPVSELGGTLQYLVVSTESVLEVPIPAP